MLLDEALEMGAELGLGRPVQLAVFVELALTQEVGPDELGEGHGLGDGGRVTLARSAQ